MCVVGACALTPFIQNGHTRTWDMLSAHNAVVCILVDTSRKSLVFVRQFRPSVYAAIGSGECPPYTIDHMNGIDWTAVAAERGLTLELCAGLCDKPDLTPAQVMAEEVYEECGYRIDAARLQYITSHW